MQQIRGRKTKQKEQKTPAKYQNNKRLKEPRILLYLKQFYVLHKLLIKRIITVLFILAILLFLFQNRENFEKYSQNFILFSSKQLSNIGLGIEEIVIKGHDLTTEQLILSALNIDNNSSLIFFDAKEGRKNLLKLPAVKDANIRKSFPNKLMINIEEFEPMALWRVGAKTYYIDEKGNKLAKYIDNNFADYALIIGEGAGDNAKQIIAALNQYQSLNEGLIAISRIADRRWDLIYDSGLRVQLPEKEFIYALNNLEQYKTKYFLFDKDISLIDLRIKNSLVVRLKDRNEN